MKASLFDVPSVQAADATILRLPPHLSTALPAGAPTLAPSTRPQNPPSELPCTVPPYSKS
jgi:hypothetical protein